MSADDQLADLLLAWEQAREAGRRPSPEQLCADCPELLPEFLRLLTNLNRLAPLLDGAEPVGHEELMKSVRAGRYVPVRFHAKGGLGIVWVAEDRELRRSVALKCMQPLAYLDPDARRRFLLEAEITGKLEHPGIAPIYGAGQAPDGHPFYAMRFIEGSTLGDAIERMHRSSGASNGVEFTRLLRVFVSVCQTVAYAHARGIIHRDLKPGNVMLGLYGETLVVDWGLAKRVRTDGDDEAADPGFAPVRLGGPVAHSLVGAVKGSPAFMSPEQARGETATIGPASDVYALGAILYVILSGQAPYRGPTAEAIVDQVRRGAPQPLGERRTGIPRPLAAICAKAMAREPGARYASASALANDVELWLADQSVSVYRDPLLTRVRRWVKRHRTAAAGAAAAALVLVAALAVTVPLLSAKNRELTKLNDALKNSNGQLAAANTAQRNDFEAADRTVRGMMDNVFSRGTGTADPQLDGLRVDAIRKYVEYLKGFIDRNRDREEVRLELALSLTRLGDWLLMLDQTDGALAATGEALARFSALRAERPDDREVLFGWSCAASSYGAQFQALGRIEQASRVLVEARDVLETLARDPAPIGIAVANSSSTGLYVDSPGYRLAEVTLALAEIQDRAEGAARADLGAGIAAEPWGEQRVEQIRKAIDLLTGGKPLGPSSSYLVVMRVYGLKVDLAFANSNRETRDRELAELVGELQAQSEQFPKGVELMLLLCEGHLRLAQSRRAAGKIPEAESALVNANVALERVGKADLGFGAFDSGSRQLADLFRAEIDMEWLLVAKTAGGTIEPNIRNVLEAMKRLAQAKGLYPGVVWRSVVVCAHVGKMAAEFEKFEYVEPLAQEALAILDGLSITSAHDPYVELMQMCFRVDLITFRAAQGKPIADLAGQVEGVLRKRLERAPNDGLLILLDAELMAARADKFIDEGAGDKAAVQYERALQRIAAAEAAGLPGAIVDLKRCLYEFGITGALGSRASQLIKDKPAGDREALELVQRAIRLLRDRPETSIRRGPTTHAQVEAYLLAKRRRLAALEEVERKARGPAPIAPE